MSTNSDLVQSVLRTKWYEMNREQMIDFFGVCRTVVSILTRKIDSKIKQLKVNPSLIIAEALEAVNEQFDQVNEVQQESYVRFRSFCEPAQEASAEAKQQCQKELSECDRQAKDFDTTGEAVLKRSNQALRVFNESYGPTTARLSRRMERGGSPDRSGEHTSDPPNKIMVSSELRPESVKLDCDQISFAEWAERAKTFFRGSNLDKQQKSVQLAYLRNLVDSSFWKEVCELSDFEALSMDDMGFLAGVELVDRAYKRRHDIFLLRLECLATKFKGSSARQALTWFYEFKKTTTSTGLFTLSQRELLNFFLLKELPSALQAKVFESTAHPELEESLERLEHLATVESMTKRPGKSSVNQINEDGNKQTNKQVICYRCGLSDHIRPNCDFGKPVSCETCGKDTHSTKAHGASKHTFEEQDKRGQRQGRRSVSNVSSLAESDNTGYSSVPNADSVSSSSSSSETERKIQKEKKKRRERREKKKEKKDKERGRERKSRKDNKPLRRNSSSTQQASSSGGSRRRSSSSRPRGRKQTPGARKTGSKKKITNAVTGRTDNTAVREMWISPEGDSSVVLTLKSCFDTGSKVNLIQEKWC